VNEPRQCRLSSIRPELIRRFLRLGYRANLKRTEALLQKKVRVPVNHMLPRASNSIGTPRRLERRDGSEGGIDPLDWEERRSGSARGLFYFRGRKRDVEVHTNEWRKDYRADFARRFGVLRRDARSESRLRKQRWPERCPAACGGASGKDAKYISHSERQREYQARHSLRRLPHSIRNNLRDLPWMKARRAEMVAGRAQEPV